MSLRDPFAPGNQLARRHGLRSQVAKAERAASAMAAPSDRIMKFSAIAGRLIPVDGDEHPMIAQLKISLGEIGAMGAELRTERPDRESGSRFLRDGKLVSWFPAYQSERRWAVALMEKLGIAPLYQGQILDGEDIDQALAAQAAAELAATYGAQGG